MKLLFYTLFLVFMMLASSSIAQDTISHGSITVWSPQGWIIKAKNTANIPTMFRFSWITTGTNDKGEVVSSITEESQMINMNPLEERQLFTAPQDPNRQITYVFGSFQIIEYIPVTMEYLIEEKRQAKIRSGQ
jgi:hypothetical protein